MPNVTLPSGLVHFSESGVGQPLILLHANPGDSCDFEAVIPALAQHFRVLALDWPGYGQSPMPASPESTTVLDMFAVLLAFMDALVLQRVILIGNSLGGNVAARMAAEYPQRVLGLVLVSPGGFTRHNVISRSFCRLQGSPLALSPYRFARLYLKKDTPQTRAMLERARGEQATQERLILNRSFWRSFGRPENDLRHLAKAIRAPTLLMFGAEDPVIPAAKDGMLAQQCMPSARMVTLPCGHAPFAELPEEFLQEVQAFVQYMAEVRRTAEIL